MISDRAAACAMYRRFYGDDPRLLPIDELVAYLAEIKGIRRIEAGKPPDLKELAKRLADKKPANG
jgi:hypothetical protein